MGLVNGRALDSTLIIVLDKSQMSAAAPRERTESRMEATVIMTLGPGPAGGPKAAAAATASTDPGAAAVKPITGQHSAVVTGAAAPAYVRGSGQALSRAAPPGPSGGGTAAGAAAAAVIAYYATPPAGGDSVRRVWAQSTAAVAIQKQLHNMRSDFWDDNG